MRVFMIFMLICVGLCGCNTISISDSDATVYSIEAIEIDDMEDGKGDIAEADSEEESFYEPEEDIFPVISAMYGESRVAINELSQCDGIIVAPLSA